MDVRTDERTDGRIVLIKLIVSFQFCDWTLWELLKTKKWLNFSIISFHYLMHCEAESGSGKPCSIKIQFYYLLIDLALTQTGWLFHCRCCGPYCPQICACANGCGWAHGWRHCCPLYCPYGKRCVHCESYGPARREQSTNDVGDIYSSRNGSPQLPWILLHCQHRIANATDNKKYENANKLRSIAIHFESTETFFPKTCLVAMKQQEKMQQ